MANTKGSTNFRNMMQAGKSSLLPPKIPFPSTSTVYSDYNINPSTGSKVTPKHNDFTSHHQRTSSESLIGEEQPSWLDDLLNEPDTPVRKGHRRSSSDSFAYTDMAGVPNMDYASLLHDEAQCNNMSLPQLWRSQDVDCHKVIQRGPHYTDPNSYTKTMNRTWEWPLTTAKYPRNSPSLRDNINPSSEISATEEVNSAPSTVAEKQDHSESGSDSKSLLEKDGYLANVASDNESKRAKQKFAQRSRVRKLQYIAELERTVQALQAEKSEFSAELEFSNQQSLILSMENKALKKRLESLAQVQLIKYMEHDVLEKEIGRLRSLYQQQQQQHEQHQRQSSSAHRRTNSKDLDSQFANLSLKHKDAGSGSDTVHI